MKGEPHTSIRPGFVPSRNHPSATQTSIASHGPSYYLGPVLMVFATFMTFRRRGMADLFVSGTDAEIKVKLAIWAILGLIALKRYPVILQNSPLLFTFPLVPYVAFCGLALLSVIYSLQPSLSAVRAGQIAIVIALALSMRDRAAEWPKLGALYLAINWAFLLIGLTGIIPALYWRDLPGFQEPGYDGFFAPWRLGTPIGHFSIISLVAAMLIVAQAARIQQTPRLPEIAYFIWVFVTLILTVSRTGILGAVLGLAVVICLRGFFLITALACMAAGSVTLMMPELLKTIFGFLERGQDAEDMASLTGRTGLYEEIFALIGDHWELGYGFRASRAAHLNEIQDSSGNVYGTAAHAHNAVLESMASLGVAGAFCAVTILVSLLACGIGLLSRAYRSQSSHQGSSRLNSSRQRSKWRAEPKASSSPGAWSRAVEFCAYWPPIIAFSMMDSSFALEINPFVFFFVAVLLDFTQYRAGLHEQGSPSLRQRPAFGEGRRA